VTNLSLNPPTPEMKGKCRIVKIPFSEEQKEEIKRILEGRQKVSRSVFVSSDKYKIDRIRKIAGGFCIKCSNFNTHLLKFKLGGITLIERYCQEHIGKIR
jgi:hypothetical protein